MNTLLKLETERLVLRKMQPEDTAFIIQIMNDPDWLRFIGNRNMTTHAAALDHIENVAQVMYAEHELGMLVVTEKSTGIAVGLAGMLQRDYLPHPDIGYAFLPSGRGKGYAFEASQALVECAKTTRPTTPFFATVNAENTASVRLLTKLGFEFDRKMKETDGEDVNLFILKPAQTIN